MRDLKAWGRRTVAFWIFLICLTANVLAQSGQALAPQTSQPPGSADAAAQPQGRSGSISGTVVDQSGALVANVKITLMVQGIASKREALSDSNGYFLFADVIPGTFQLTFNAFGFATVKQAGILQDGEHYLAPQIALVVARADVDVDVNESAVQVAEDQIKIEEKQRVLGFIPNYYVSYIPKAAPLPPRLKFQLAWKSIINPYTFAITGAIAGIEQANDSFSGYGQGAQGYAKRYGAAYADLVTGTLIGGAILPSLLKQDPRYFYKGTGSRKSRILYAIATSVICKSDKGRWQPDYSGIMGGLAAGGISNLYYPAQNRNGVAITFENALIGIAGGAGSNILQEFVVRRFTPHVPPPDPLKP
ncbi:MAG: carboxypeptidase-like regulatory domain-containing protein [Candidatus Sulfotelmatobacter sp.]